MARYLSEVSPEDFYGKKSIIQQKIERLLESENTEKVLGKFSEPKFMTSLLGPSRTWKVFQRQQDAIEFCFKRRNGLMCFAYEDINFRRMFLVAHPKVFWSFNHHRFFKNCNTYEIIQEFAACKLYLDIEYEYKYNPNSNQERMLTNLLNIININLNLYFNINVKKDDILELDSSSDAKFSRHVIYEIKNVAFENNYAVGHFIKIICNELKEAYECNIVGDCEKIQQLSKKYGLHRDDILELFINNDKQKVKLMVDEGVYTKNRHFRVLGSSKQSKKIPLMPSKNNLYRPIESADGGECSLFVDSLVTCFSWPVTRVLEMEECNVFKKNAFGMRYGKGKEDVAQKEINNDINVYPQIDSFIRRLIFPKGKIRRKVYFADTSTVVYEIQGYRYCDNIGREHKSNNIKYIVDLKILAFYQKCYDPDCIDFRSLVKPLPEEIRFYFEDESFFESSPNPDSPDFPDEQFFSNVFSSTNEKNMQENTEKEQKKMNSFSLGEETTEEDLAEVADCLEALVDVKW